MVSHFWEFVPITEALLLGWGHEKRPEKSGLFWVQQD